MTTTNPGDKMRLNPGRERLDYELDTKSGALKVTNLETGKSHTFKKDWVDRLLTVLLNEISLYDICWALGVFLMLSWLTYINRDQLVFSWENVKWFFAIVIGSAAIQRWIQAPAGRKEPVKLVPAPGQERKCYPHTGGFVQDIRVIYRTEGAYYCMNADMLEVLGIQRDIMVEGEVFDPQSPDEKLPKNGKGWILKNQAAMALNQLRNDL